MAATVPRRRRLDPAERRREILDAAIDQLAQRGPDACRVEDITTAAGTAKGNFYRYFSTFDDLLLGVRDHLLQQYRLEVDRRMARRIEIDWWQVLEEEIDTFLDFQVELGALHEIVFHGPAARATPIDRELSAADMIATLLRAGIADGAYRSVDVEATAALIFHLLHGAADQIMDGDDPRRTRRAVQEMIAVALRQSLD